MLRKARGAQLLLRIKIRRSLFRSEQALYQSIFLPAPDNMGQNLSRKVRASLDQIRDRSCAPIHRLPYGSYSDSPALAMLTLFEMKVGPFYDASAGTDEKII